MHGFDRLRALQKSANDSVHPIHDSAIGGQDDRVRRVDLLNQSDVCREFADREGLGPVNGVDLPE
jgi:hypothetical protein